MRTVTTPVILSIAGAGLWMGVTYAQFGRGGGDWSTGGADAQRSSWVRTDPKISRESMMKPGFQFLWKVKLNNDARQLSSLTQTIILDRYIGYRGFRSLGYVGGSSDNVFALDTDLGKIEWHKRISSAAATGDSETCPGGMTTALTRPTGAEYPMTQAADVEVGAGVGMRLAAPWVSQARER